jgi:hypothetical protein
VTSGGVQLIYPRIWQDIKSISWWTIYKEKPKPKIGGGKKQKYEIYPLNKKTEGMINSPRFWIGECY